MSQNGVLVAKALDPACFQRQKLVQLRDGALAVRNHDHDAASRPQLANGAIERKLAFPIEMRVGLVEHDQKWLAEDSPRQRNALALPSRQIYTVRADDGFVSLGKQQDQLVHTGELGGRNDRFRGRILAEARDILPNCPTEELQVLRQVTDMGSEILFAPLLQGGAIEPHFPLHHGPGTKKATNERRFSAAAGADDAHSVAGLQFQARSLDDDRLAVGRRDGDRANAERLVRAAEIDARQRSRCRRKLRVQASPALASGGDAAPMGDGHIDGGEGAREGD